MLLEEKLRRVPSVVGPVVAATAGLHLAVSRLGFSGSPADPALDVALILLGGSLLLHNRWKHPRAGFVCAALAALVVGVAVFADFRAGALSAEAILFRSPRVPATGPVTPQIPADTAIAVFASALALALFGRRMGRARRSLSASLSIGVLALSVACIITNTLQRVTPFVRPFHIGTPTAVLLFALTTGALLLRPDSKLLRLLLAPSSTGSLARRLFGGVTLLPAGLIGLTLILMTIRVIEPIHGPIFLLTGLIISGFVHAMLSAESAVLIEDRRKTVESEHTRLNAVLEQQAARLQELVARRTSELRALSVNLRTTARENAQLGLVARNTTNGVVITDAEGRLEWANNAFERMTGYTLAEVKGRKPGHFLQGPDTDPGVIAQLHRAIQAGERCYVEILNYTKSRHRYWQIVDMEPVRDANGKLINWIAIQTDVTAHRLAEQHLRVLNERLQLATQSAALGVWEWDAASHKLTWDERTHAVHGVAGGGFDGTFDAWMRPLHPEDRAAVQARFDAVLSGANRFEQGYRVLHPEHPAPRYVQARAVVQRDAQARLVRITGTARDVTAERESEERLRALTDRWQLALRASGYGVWDLDPTTGRFIWDDRLFEIYGVKRETFSCTYEGWLNLLHPEDRLRLGRPDEDPLRPGRGEIDNEFRIVHANGLVRHIESHAHIRRDETGRAVRVVGMDRDVTAEKQTLEALRMAEERWQLAVEGTNDGVWDWNIATGVTYHDVRWAQMLGYDPDALSNTIETWNSLVHPDDLPACLAATEEHFAGRLPLYHHEYRMRTRQGDWKWILDRGKVVARDAHGQPLRMVGMHTDVTARKNLEQRLHQYEQLTTQVSALAQIGGWELDLETMQLTWSEQVRRIHEVDATYRPTLQTSIEFYAPQSRDIISTALKAAMTHGRDYDLELPLITAAGRRIWVRALTRAEMRDQRPVRLIGALQDISSRRDSEEARRKLEFQLFQAQKMETLGTLAGGIAHDFNNLLTGIMGYQELVADVLGDNQTAKEYLTEARGASIRARELVEQILTFGRQSPDDQHTSLDLALVVEEARRLLRATIPATIAIETHLDPECGPVLGDATQIHQVLLNLGSNAAHAMQHKGGVLAISLQSANKLVTRTATMSTLPPGEYVRLTVSDTGHGIDETTLQRIFDPFFTTKEVREGTGLGLAVVHGIVRAHRGAIEVESRVGSGSNFHIYLPVATADVELPGEEALQAPRGSGETVYIVDDEDTVASFTKFALENKGYHAMTIDTASHCLEALRANPAGCAVLVTDQTMPGMTGMEMAAKVREFTATLPIVVMSGYFLKISAEDLAQIGRIELLGKPFTTDELAWMVHRALHPTAPVAAGG